MTKNNNSQTDIDWSLTTWEGARRESLRRWSQLPLEQIIAALEEMEELSAALANLKPKQQIGEDAGSYPSTNKSDPEK